MAKFDSINYVPPRLRKLRGVPLSLSQINTILEGADALVAGGDNFPVALSKSRDQFQTEHKYTPGAWVKKAAE